MECTSLRATAWPDSDGAPDGYGHHGMAKAQTDTGRVVGTVADATGAYIPGATVTLTNIDTGATQTRTTGGAGEFTFPALPRGHYSVTGTASGFRSEMQKFQLDVQEVQTVNFKLTTGTAEHDGGCDGCGSGDRPGDLVDG